MLVSWRVRDHAAEVERPDTTALTVCGIANGGLVGTSVEA
jgi:hypothetical protein